MGMINDATSALIIAPPGRMRVSLKVLLYASEAVKEVFTADSSCNCLDYLISEPPTMAFIDMDLPSDEVKHTLDTIKYHCPQIQCSLLPHNSDQIEQAKLSQADGILPPSFSAASFFHFVTELIKDC